MFRTAQGVENGCPTRACLWPENIQVGPDAPHAVVLDPLDGFWDDPRLCGHLCDVIYTLSYQETCDCGSPNLPISPEIWLNLGRSRTISRNLPANRCVLDPQTHTSFARSLRDLSDEYSMWGSVSMTPARTGAPPAAAPRPERRYLCIHSTFNRVYRGYIDPYTKKTHFLSRF